MTTIRTARLPGDVILADDGLHDPTRIGPVGLNRTAHTVVAEVAAGHALPHIVDRFAAQFGIDPSTAERDVEQLLYQLNAQHLLNLCTCPARRLARELRVAAATGRVPSLRAAHHRYPIDTTNVRRAATGTLQATIRPAIATLAILTPTVAVILATILPLTTALAAAAAAATATAIATTAHEIGHAIALQGVPAYAATTPLAIRLHHPNTAPHPRITALAGPAIPILTGAALTVGALLGRTAVLALIALPFSAHTLGITTLTTDGRHLINRIPPKTQS